MITLTADTITIISGHSFHYLIAATGRPGVGGPEGTVEAVVITISHIVCSTVVENYPLAGFEYLKSCQVNSRKVKLMSSGHLHLRLIVNGNRDERRLDVEKGVLFRQETDHNCNGHIFFSIGAGDAGNWQLQHDQLLFSTVPK